MSHPTINLKETGSDPTLFKEIATEMESWLGEDSSGHDMDHAWRVFNLGVRIAKTEDADVEVVGAASLTHDIHRSMREDGESVHPEESLPEVRRVLNATSFPVTKVSEVLHCVEVHDEYSFHDEMRPAETLEAEVLRDADNLDAIGAVGIARNFAFTGVVGNPLWAPETDDYSGIRHCYDKLLLLKGEMNTDSAHALAEDRHEFLEQFVDRFEQEWYGDQ